MAKKANNKKNVEKKTAEKVQKNSGMLAAAMQVFLAGCAAEAWMLLVRRYLVNGTVDEMLTFADVVISKYMLVLSPVLLVLGILMTVVWRASKRRLIGVWVTGAGAFLGLSSYISYAFLPTGINALCVVVPIATLLGLSYFLYQREFFWSASILGLGILDLWACRRALGHGSLGTVVLVGTLGLMVFLVLVLLAFRKAEQMGGKLGTVQWMPVGSSYTSIYGACGVSVVAMAAALVNSVVAYYLIWVLAICIFALAVYYTVKQL